MRWPRGGVRPRATTPAETPSSDRSTSRPFAAEAPLAILGSPALCFRRGRAAPLWSFADVGIMRPQPVNNETKDVAHQLRPIYCLASTISSAPPPPQTPASVCVFSLRLCARLSDAISASLLSASSSLGCFQACARTKKIHINQKCETQGPPNMMGKGGRNTRKKKV